MSENVFIIVNNFFLGMSGITGIYIEKEEGHAWIISTVKMENEYMEFPLVA